MTNFEGPRQNPEIGQPNFEPSAEFDMDSVTAGEVFAKWAANDAGMDQDHPDYDAVVGEVSRLTGLTLDVATATSLKQPTYTFFKETAAGRKPVSFAEYTSASADQLAASVHDEQLARRIMKKSIELGFGFIEEAKPVVGVFTPRTGEFTVRSTNTDTEKE